MRYLLLITTLLFAGTVAAVEPVEHVYQARAHVTPAGTVEAVEPQEGMIPQVAAMVTSAVQSTTFTPATVNGEPAASKTTVWVKIRFEGVEGDATGTQLAGRVLDVSQRNPFMLPGAFPRGALMNGTSAKVWIEVALLPDGSVDPSNSRVVQADVRAASGKRVNSGRDSKALQEAALASALTWKLFPEEVAGVAQSTRLVVPMTYCTISRRKALNGQCHDFEAGPEAKPRAAADANVQLARLNAPSAAPEA